MSKAKLEIVQRVFLSSLFSLVAMEFMFGAHFFLPTLHCSARIVKIDTHTANWYVSIDSIKTTCAPFYFDLLVFSSFHYMNVDCMPMVDCTADWMLFFSLFLSSISYFIFQYGCEQIQCPEKSIDFTQNL